MAKTYQLLISYMEVSCIKGQERARSQIYDRCLHVANLWQGSLGSRFRQSRSTFRYRSLILKMKTIDRIRERLLHYADCFGCKIYTCRRVFFGNIRAKLPQRHDPFADIRNVQCCLSDVSCVAVMFLLFMQLRRELCATS